MRPRALGALIALIVFAADQAVKAAVLSRFTEAGPESTPFTPFLDLALRWNAGISFSLFTQDSSFGRAVLLGVTAGGDGCSRLVAMALQIEMGRRRTGRDHRRGARQRR